MQSKLESIVERSADLTTGVILSYLVQAYILFPLLNIQATHAENAIVVGVLTIVSFVRGYICRRIFNRLTIRKLKKEKHHGT